LKKPGDKDPGRFSSSSHSLKICAN